MPPQLDLHFSTIKEGRTVLRSGYSRFPLRHSPELHLSESLPSLATCFITNSSGGMFERDQLEVCVRLDADSKLQLLNLSATLLHKCDQLTSRETSRFEIGDNAYFEMVRKPLIPTSGSDYEQNSYLEIGRGAIAVIADTVFSGRYSSGERHRYKAIKLGLDVVFQGKRLVSERSTMMLNAIRAHFAEFGIIAAQGPRKVADLVGRLRDDDTLGLPEVARSALVALAGQLESLAAAVRSIERQLMAWHRQNAASQRLETIPGVGIITATALAASVPDPAVFKSGRQFAAYLGLVPRQNSSGGKDRLGHISKMGNGYLRRLLVVGATSVTRRAPTTDTRTGAWVRSLLERKPTRLVTVAIANKTARTAWALLVKGEDYKAVPAI